MHFAASRVITLTKVHTNWFSRRRPTLLPVALTRYFPDSRVQVDAFSSGENKLSLRIVKEIGPETGIIDFRQVSFLSLPSAMPGESIRSKLVSEAGPEFWSVCRLARDWFDHDDVVFEIESQDGPVYFVVAKSVGYHVITSNYVARAFGDRGNSDGEDEMAI